VIIHSIRTWLQQLEEGTGQALAEYGLIMSVIAISAVGMAIIAFRSEIVDLFR